MLTTVGYLKPDDLQARVSLNNIHLSPTFDAWKEMEVTIKHFFYSHCPSTPIYRQMVPSSYQDPYNSIATQQLSKLYVVL